MSVSLQTRRTAETGTRPPSVKWTIGILTFLGLTALGGGIEMVAFYQGNEYLPAGMLEDIPFDNFIVPGLILGGVFGLGSLFVAWGMWRRPEIGLLRWVGRLTDLHWAWAGAVLIGLGFTMWMVVEMSLPGAPWAQRGCRRGDIGLDPVWDLWNGGDSVVGHAQLRSVRRHMLEDTSR